MIKKLALASAFAIACSGVAFAADSSPTVTMTVSETHKGAMATADISISPATTEKGQLMVQWTSPASSNKSDCTDSMTPIKANISNLQSSRTLWYQASNGQPIACDGVWKVEVVEKATGKVLASGQYDNTVS